MTLSQSLLMIYCYCCVVLIVLYRLLATNEKLENEQNKHRKEERLMLSAVYEVSLEADSCPVKVLPVSRSFYVGPCM